MSRPRHAHLLVVLLVTALVAATAIGTRTRALHERDRDVERSGSDRAETAATSLELAVLSALDRVHRDPVEPRAPAANPSNAAIPTDLVELLRAVTRAERARNAGDFAMLVDEALSPRHGLASILDLLERRGFDGDAEPFEGALTVVASAATRESAHGGSDLAHILSRLPFQLENARERLAVRLSDLEVDGRLVLHAQWWPTLLELQRAHPELAEDFGPLFANLDRDTEALYGLSDVMRRAAGHVEFPGVVAAAIRGLTVLDPELGASIVRDLGERSDLDVRLQHELARLSASLLPPNEAVEALVGQARSIAMPGMAVLGDRPDASEALRRKYADLALSSGTEHDRMNVIAGMRHEESRVLLDIARTDTSVRVREQAVLMLSSSRSVDIDTVRALHDLRHAGRDSIAPRHYTTALANVIVHSNGQAREEALELLRAVVVDLTVTEADRSRAAELVERHTPAPDDSTDAPVGESSAIQAGK